MCDLAVASRDARFAVSGVNLGLFCSTPSVALSRNLGRKAAFEMLVTGDFISADEAGRAASSTGSPRRTNSMPKSNDWRRQHRRQAARGDRARQGLFYRQVEAGIAAAYDDAGRTMACNMMDAARSRACRPSSRSASRA